MNSGLVAIPRPRSQVLFLGLIPRPCSWVSFPGLVPGSHSQASFPSYIGDVSSPSCPGNESRPHRHTQSQLSCFFPQSLHLKSRFNTFAITQATILGIVFLLATAVITVSVEKMKHRCLLDATNLYSSVAGTLQYDICLCKKSY